MKLIGISGSLRQASTNRLLIREAARLAKASAYVEADIDLPLYNGDVEAEGIPASVLAFTEAVAAADAVVISTPEYNKGISGVLKNALDWASRVKTNPFTGKPIAIVSATAGRAGGERAQFNLRLALNPFQPVVIPGPEVLIAASSKAFDEAGHLGDEMAQKLLTDLMEKLKATL
ncbi:MAG: NADPH-dependent FMN reductase [Pseudomonadota bacterium]